MGKAFLNAYSLLLIKTCHRRGAFAMGGMAAQIPVKGDKQANEAAFAKVRADKEREATQRAMTAPGSPTQISCRLRWKYLTG